MWRRSPRSVALLAMLLAGSVALALAPGASAQQTDKQRQLSQEIAETSKATQQARDQAQAFQAEKAKLDATVGGLQAQLDASQAGLAAAQAELERIAFVSSLLTAQIDETQRKLEDASDDAKTSAVLLYKRPGNAGAMDLIGSTDGAGEVVEARRYLDSVAQKRRNDLARAERLRKALDQQKAELDDQQQQADAARAQADAKAREIESLLAQQQAARDGAARAQAGYEARVADLSAKQAADEGELAAEDAKVRALLASVSNDVPASGNDAGGGTSGGGTSGGTSSGGGGGGTGQFLRPVSGQISSGFGYRTDPITGAQSFHSGLDFATSCGNPIQAAGNGVVVLAGSDGGGYGNYVIINHGGGYATLYGHQSAIAVSNGQAVTAGQVIGYVGSTGRSTGCHLHFEVRVNGNAVNPAGYL